MDGFLNINKPKGFTSHDIVDWIRKRFKISRVGHLGTLDPIARGVLPLALGKATKFTALLTQGDKEYEGLFLLGVQTDTQDIEGKIFSLSQVPPITIWQLEEIFRRFLGEQKQLTPMYSARRYKGRRLFEWARKNKEVKRDFKKIDVYEFKILVLEPPLIRFYVHCSKGTYIRTLAHDLGKIIGCGACLLDLVRLRKGPFIFSESVNLSRLTDLESLKKYIISDQEILSKVNSANGNYLRGQAFF